jgi:hypothetical protein
MVLDIIKLKQDIRENVDFYHIRVLAGQKSQECPEFGVN